ncbi:MAG: hypothetical protein IH940_06955 [Acidobacteria bacterium]|nr:hypothetical protein [Acidobacteriota bacterium]
MDHNVDRDRAELASNSTQIDDLTARILAIAEQYVDGDREDVSMQLFEIERTLRSANRRLRGVLKSI